MFTPPSIPATVTATEIPETRAVSRKLVDCIAAFIPVSPFYRATDNGIGGLCDDQYITTLEWQQACSNKAAYITSKSQTWFRTWHVQAAAPGTPGEPAPGDPTPANGKAAAPPTPKAPAPALSEGEEDNEDEGPSPSE